MKELVRSSPFENSISWMEWKSNGKTLFTTKNNKRTPNYGHFKFQMEQLRVLMHNNHHYNKMVAASVPIENDDDHSRFEISQSFYSF